MPRIRLLDDRLISQIAAGEVVERPASVVKELLENALDAGTTELRLELEAGGKRQIRLADNGRGMDSDDALLAFDRHATSKIATFDDLVDVGSFGFRGEALASIAAVARVELRTAQEPGDGHRVVIEGGRVVKAEPVAHPRGTRIEVRSLFFNVPARRKFLKRPETELRRCVEVVQGYALARPDVRFTLEHGGRRLLDTTAMRPGTEDLRQRIAQVFGRTFAESLVEVPAQHSRGDESIHGFLGGHGGGRQPRRSFLFVNRRLVRDRAILAIFYRAVRDIWKTQDYPSLFLFLDLPPAEVDVNVHPQKAEVRFRDSAFVSRVEAALRDTLQVARGEEPAPLRVPSASAPRIGAAWEGLGGRGGEAAAGTARAEVPALWQRGKERPATAPAREPWVPHRDRGTGAEAAGEVREPAAAYGQQRIAEATIDPPKPQTIPLSGRSGKARPFRLLGQYKGSLILLEGPDGLYLLDQHVAHERILYERLRRSLAAEKPVAQRLLTPPMLELSRSEAMRLEELAPALEGCGFELNIMSGGSVALMAVPSVLTVEQAEPLLLELAASREIEAEAEALAEGILEALAASLSCRAAIKIHHPLSVPKMEALVSELFKAEQPYSCPHGRPVVLQMTDVELERRFGRR